MILNPHNREQALLRIIALQIIVNAEVSDIESFLKATDLLTDLTFYVGGGKGVEKIAETLEMNTNALNVGMKHFYGFTIFALSIMKNIWKLVIAPTAVQRWKELANETYRC